MFKSKTIWGLIMVLVPYLDMLYQWLSNIPEGMLPEKLRLAVQGLGLLLATYGRLVAKRPLL